MQDFLGWIPAVILPVSTALQLLKIITSRSVQGVSIVSWLLFGFANLGAYFFTGKMEKPQAILAFLVSAFLDFIIVWMIFKMKNHQSKAA